MAEREEKNPRPADEEDFSDITEFRPERGAFFGESGPVPMREERTIRALQKPWVILLMLGIALLLAGVCVFFFRSVTINQHTKVTEPTSMIPQSKMEGLTETDTEKETEVTSVEISEKTKASGDSAEESPSGSEETEENVSGAEENDSPENSEPEESTAAENSEAVVTEENRDEPEGTESEAEENTERTEIIFGEALFRIDDGGLTLISCGNGDEVMVFPEYIEDYPFEGVNDEAFSGCTGARAIILPDTVCWIGARAFAGCENLTEVSMGSNVADFSETAFEGAEQVIVVAPAGSAAGIYAVNHGLSFRARE